MTPNMLTKRKQDLFCYLATIANYDRYSAVRQYGRSAILD